MSAARDSARSDALVFFGATGDLAYKKIFPALQAMAKKGHLDFPVVGVAKSGWGLEQLVERARASVTENDCGLDPEAFPRLAEKLRYVDGDYADPDTFARLRAELGRAERPAHYLAIPPSMPAAPGAARSPTTSWRSSSPGGSTRRSRNSAR